MDKKTIITILAMALATVLILSAASARRGETELTTVQYTVQSGLEEPIRLVQLSDLHGHVFGHDNEKLVQLVAEQEPDLILMTGDMLDKSDENAAVACRLIEQLTPIAPVYYGYGNHETAWEARTGKSLTPDLEQAGACVLELTWQDVQVRGQTLRLGGYSGYYGYPGMLVDASQWDAHHAFYSDFENTDEYKVLLCHIPTTWLDWGDKDKMPVDLVLTGHYHGGQIRIPLIGGLYAPYVGLFPEFTEGIFYGEQATCILTTGLGSSPGIPRINNLPQISVVDLVP